MWYESNFSIISWAAYCVSVKEFTFQGICDIPLLKNLVVEAQFWNHLVQWYYNQIALFPWEDEVLEIVVRGKAGLLSKLARWSRVPTTWPTLLVTIILKVSCLSLPLHSIPLQADVHSRTTLHRQCQFLTYACKNSAEGKCTSGSKRIFLVFVSKTIYIANFTPMKKIKWHFVLYSHGGEEIEIHLGYLMSNMFFLR